MSKHYYGNEDLDFLSPPGLGEAMWGNKIKSLLLLAGVYTAGAVIGRSRSVQGASFAGRKLGAGAAWSARKLGQAAAKVQEPKGSPANFATNPPFTMITSHQLEKK